MIQQYNTTTIPRRLTFTAQAYSRSRTTLLVSLTHLNKSRRSQRKHSEQRCWDRANGVVYERWIALASRALCLAHGPTLLCNLHFLRYNLYFLWFWEA